MKLASSFHYINLKRQCEQTAIEIFLAASLVTHYVTAPCGTNPTLDLMMIQTCCFYTGEKTISSGKKKSFQYDSIQYMCYTLQAFSCYQTRLFIEQN